MPTIEGEMSDEQNIRNVTGMREQMVDGANHIKAMLASGEDMNEIIRVARGNAAGFLRRLQYQKDLENTPARWAKLSADLSALGITKSQDVRNDMAAMMSVAEDMVFVNADNVEAKADIVLANVPALNTAG